MNLKKKFPLMSNILHIEYLISWLMAHSSSFITLESMCLHFPWWSVWILTEVFFYVYFDANKLLRK